MTVKTVTSIYCKNCSFSLSDHTETDQTIGITISMYERNEEGIVTSGSFNLYLPVSDFRKFLSGVKTFKELSGIHETGSDL